MKDFCKFSKSQSRHSTEWGVRWPSSINSGVDMLAYVVSDSSAAKAVLRCLQKEVGSAPRRGNRGGKPWLDASGC
jgi:hypothetical protein